MKVAMKKMCALVCTLAMLISSAAVCGLSVSAYTGGGMSGSSSVRKWGCDLSYYNVGSSSLNYSYIDFQKMYNDGCDFVILRIGYEGSATRTDTMDKAFLQLYKNARQVDGLKIGVYFYSLAYSYAAAKQDAEWVMNVIESNDMYFEYPIYYDVEDPGSSTDSTRPGHSSLTATQLTQLCLGWAETLEAGGYFPGVYGIGSSMNKLTSSYTDKYDVWFAKVKTDGHGTQYDPNAYDYSSTCGMWQYSWYDYNFDGVTLDFMDADVAYKDYASIIEPQGLNRCQTGHTISFESNGGTTVSNQTVVDGGTVTWPTNPTRRGFTFDGWYCNPELTDVYNFDTPVSYDFTLYAKWSEMYWSAIGDLMPVDGKLTMVQYESGGQIWPYWNTADGSVTMYSGVDGFAWPSAYMSYENSFDATNDRYIRVVKGGTAKFNAVIDYLDSSGNEQSVLLSTLAGKGTDDFDGGYAEIIVDFGSYLQSNGGIWPSGNAKILKCTYFVIGEKDTYVTLYAMGFTRSGEQTITTYETLYGADGITQSGDAGSYTYNDGVLHMIANGTDGYSVTFPINKEINPTQLTHLLMDLSATTTFNITFALTLETGSVNMEMRREYFNLFDLSTLPTALPAGNWNLDMDLLGYYEWNGGAISSSTIQSVTVTIIGSGELTLSALQASAVSSLAYVKDGRTMSGQADSAAPSRLTSNVYTVDQDGYVSKVTIKTTAAQFKANFDQSDYVAVYTADGTEVADNAVMKTGMIVSIVSGGVRVKNYQVAVAGDISGVGSFETATARRLLLITLGKQSMDILTTLAADYDGNGTVDTADVRMMIFDLANTI